MPPVWEVASAWYLPGVFCLGIAVSFVNSLAGGGSALSIPTLIVMGLPPAMAQGTNRLGVLWGTFSAILPLRRAGHLDPRSSALILAPTALGAFLGSLLAVELPDAIFNPLLAVVVLGVVFTVRVHAASPPAPPGAHPGADSIPAAAPLHAPDDSLGPATQAGPPDASAEAAGPADKEPSPSRLAAMFFVLALYGGLIQAGTGLLVMWACGRWTGWNIYRINAIKAVSGCVLLLVALPVFGLRGQIHWPLALCLGGGCWMGGLAGSHWQLRRGENWILWAVRLVGAALALGLLKETFL